MKINKTNVNALYDLIVSDDDILCGIQWDDLCISEYDTPFSIIDRFVRIFIDTEFTYFEDDDFDKEHLIANFDERKLALSQYLELVAKKLKEDIE